MGPLGSLAIGVLMGASGAAQDAYAIERRLAECLLRHEQQYLGAPASLLFIYPSLCPTVDPSQAERDRLARNHVLRPNAGSSTIVLNRRERACFFRRLRIQTTRNPRNRLIYVSTTGCA